VLAVSGESRFQIHPKTTIFIADNRYERCQILGISVREHLPHAGRRAETNKHLKKMVTLDDNMLDLRKLSPLEYLWFIACKCFF
jgi:hypothetical protein